MTHAELDAKVRSLRAVGSPYDFIAAHVEHQNRPHCIQEEPMPTPNDPRAEVRELLSQMKADGIAVKVTLNAAGVEGPATRAMSLIDEEARALGMTYGDEG